MQQFKFQMQVSQQYYNNPPYIKYLNLENYQSSPDQTAYSKMRQAALSPDEGCQQYWFAVALLAVEGTREQLVYCMKGDKEWLQNVEYFQKYVEAGPQEYAPVSIGFIDKQHKIRVEFENGAVMITHLTC